MICYLIVSARHQEKTPAVFMYPYSLDYQPHSMTGTRIQSALDPIFHLHIGPAKTNYSVLVLLPLATLEFSLGLMHYPDATLWSLFILVHIYNESMFYWLSQ
jgi:hypothetical protein